MESADRSPQESNAPSAEVRLRRNLIRALELFEVGLDMKRQSLRRAHPELGLDAIEELLRAWLRDRPLDGIGVERDWPRK